MTRYTEHEITAAKVKLAGVLLLCALDAVVLMVTKWAA